MTTPKRRATSTSNFGVGKRESHDASGFYERFAAKGEVGDPDPLTAIEDELRDFGADEVIIATTSGERTSWLANRMLGHLARELDVPVRQVAVAADEPRTTAHSGSSEA